MFATVAPLLFGTAIASPISGDYDGLLLAVDPSRQLVTGYFESYTVAGQFSCIFYLRGNLGNSVTKIKTWFPSEKDPKEIIEGVIKETSVEGQPAVTVKLEKEHGGCWNVQNFADSAAEQSLWRLTEAGKWKEIRVVSSPRSYFHDKPQDGTKRKAYVVTGNALRVYEINAGWMRAEFVRDGVQNPSFAAH